MITSLTIKGFKSIKNLDGFKLNRINIFIGANGAGKSNIITFFKLMESISSGKLNFYTRQQGGAERLLHFGKKYTPEMKVEISNEHYNNSSLSFSLYPANDNGLIIDKFTLNMDYDGSFTQPISYVGTLFDDGNFYQQDEAIRSVFGSFFNYGVYHFHDTSENARVKAMHGYNDNLYLRNNAENIAPYLKMLRDKYPKNYNDIVNTIKFILPFFGGFIHRDDEFLELEWYQKDHADTIFNAHALSDGSLRFICLATLLLQPTSKMPNTILIDEPELGLHPTAIAILCELIHSIRDDVQVIIGTQSAELLNYFSLNDIITVNNVNNCSEFKRLNEEDYSIWLEDYSVGDLWLKNILTAGVSYD